LFNVITGYLAPTAGKIVFNDHDITRMEPHKIAKLGIGRTFQASSLFMKTTVFDNVFTGFHLRYKGGAWNAFLNTLALGKEEDVIRQKVIEILDFLELTPHKDKLAQELSSGYRKALAIGVALAVNPKLLLLDEPATTLSPDKVEMIMKLIMKVRLTGTTIIMIEHNMKAIMDYCDRIAVLAYGKKIAEGLPQEIRENKKVIESYLGAMG
jgi:branched-chain amino acid transport system ATP-binding protein